MARLPTFPKFVPLSQTPLNFEREKNLSEKFIKLGIFKIFLIIERKLLY